MDERRPKPDLVELLEALEQQRSAQGMPVGARNRVQLAIRNHESKRRARWRRWVPVASFVAGAALVLAVVGNRWPEAEAESEPAPAAAPLVVAAAPAVGAFVVEGRGGCVLGQHDGASDLAAQCSLVAPHMSVHVWEPATVKAEGRNVRVSSGKVLFEVDEVPEGEAPIEVAVSHGRIEVVGTRFAVEQRPDGGHVDLLEGKIRFHRADGSVQDVLPGERLSWPEPQLAPGPEVEFVEPDVPPPVRKRARRGTQKQAAAIIERVTALRAEKRYGAAITEVRRALRRPWDRRTAQVLSYELGELLRAAEDTLAACDHFAAHQRRYPSGRYATAVERVLERLDCE
ncbi:MAG: FecR domain-containing protein [Nannocystaceae bacterium]|nr:FecR family protein [bacterium]